MPLQSILHAWHQHASRCCALRVLNTRRVLLISSGPPVSCCAFCHHCSSLSDFITVQHALCQYLGSTSKSHDAAVLICLTCHYGDPPSHAKNATHSHAILQDSPDQGTAEQNACKAELWWACTGSLGASVPRWLGICHVKVMLPHCSWHVI